MEKFKAGRKFIVTVLSQLMAFYLMYNQSIDPGVYATVTVSTVGAYIAGNVYQKSIEK